VRGGEDTAPSRQRSEAPPVDSNHDLADRLARLYSGVIFDVMRSLGLNAGVLPPGLHALDPNLRLAGPVWTVSGSLVEAADAQETLLDWTRMLSRAPAGSVVVCEPNNEEIALLGELSAQALKLRGVRGFVVDGGCRDTEFIRDLGFAVFCRFKTPRDIVGRWLTSELGGTVTIGAVKVTTGDYLLGDQDGIVVIPAERALDVIEAAEAAAAVEDKVRTAILGGTDPEQAYLRYGKF
jgi:4-hydroxy-4-methyl-2-oxoglutarate aldolase